MSKKTILLLLTSFLSIFLVGIFASPANAANLPVQGYAWSDNIGWIQFDPTKNINNDVRLDDQTGDLNGYAWSDNIGWVWFDATDATHPSAKVDSYTSCSGTCTVSGWAKAIAADGNGWDGWIKMSDTWTNGATLDKSVSPYKFNGFAWGSDVVGWTSLSDTVYGVIITPLGTPTLTISPSSASIQMGETQQFTVFYDPDGSGPQPTQDVTSSAVWTSDNSSIATINSSGLATGIVEGSTLIRASYNSLNANASITITAAPEVLSVLLSATPNFGTAPLNDVDLTADVLGESGTINYTFYCNRSDSGTNITFPYDAKYDAESATTKTAQDVCDYSSEGTYTAKIIVERGSSSAEDRVTITVTSGAAPVNFSLSNSNAIHATLIGTNPAVSRKTTISVVDLEGGFSADVALHVSSVKKGGVDVPLSTFSNYNFSDGTLSYISGENYESSQFWVNVPTGTTPGLYVITIQGDGGSLSRETTVNLNIEFVDPGWWQF